MGFYRIGNALAGKPGVGFYNVEEDDFKAYCCGLIVRSVTFELLDSAADPFCLRKASGTEIVCCSQYPKTIEGATLLAVDYLDQIRFIAFGNTVPGRPCGFCEGSVYLYYLVDAEIVDNQYIIKFEVEDCSNAGSSGIPPRDYLCTIVVENCPK